MTNLPYFKFLQVCQYKSTEQRLKIFDGTPQSDILDLIKRAFHIKEDISKIFLHDGDGDLICLPPKIPNGLCVYVYIEPDLRPTLSHETDHLFIDSTTSDDQQSNSEQTSSNGQLPGFKWDGTFSKLDGHPAIINDGYTLGNHNGSGWTPVFSTTTYTKGKLFTKMTIELSVYQTVGIYSVGDPATIEHGLNSDTPFFATREFIGYEHEGKILSIALLLDNDNHYVELFWIKDDTVLKRMKKNIPKGPSKIYAWTKGSPITIQEGGSSPIPSYIK